MKTIRTLSLQKIVLICLLLLTLPILLYLLQTEQENRSRAQKAATLHITTANDSVAVGQNLDFDVVLTPGSNLVSIVELHLEFDSAHFSPQVPLFTPNASAFPVTIEEAFIRDGVMITTLSIGSDPSKAITQETVVGTFHLTASTSTQPAYTQITFSDETSISSLGPDDDPSENVLAGTTPAVITVTSGTITLTPSVTPSATPSTSVTLTPTVTTITTPTLTTTPTPPLTSGQTCGTLKLTDADLPIGITRFGSEMWVTSFGNSQILRLKMNGLPSAPPISGTGLNSPLNLEVMDEEAWIINYGGASILRFDKNGQSVGEPIFLSDQLGTALPYALGVVGNEVWVSEIFTGQIFRFDRNGNQIGNPFSIDDVLPTAIIAIDEEVWVVAFDRDFTDLVYRLDTESNEIAPPITLSGIVSVFDIAYINNAVWLSGFSSQNSEWTIMRLDKNGNILGSTPTGLEYPAGIALANEQVWITDIGKNADKNNLVVYTTNGNYFPCPDSNPKIAFTMLLDGIGTAGDRANPANSSLSNKSPVTTNRRFLVEISDTQNQLAALGNGELTYNAGLGAYTGDLTLSQVVNGDFTAKIKTDGYVSDVLPDTLQLAENKTVTTSQANLVAGDINGDDSLDILDYNILRDCGYGVTNPLPMSDQRSTYNSLQCIVHNSRDFADLNDNGIIDSRDYNLFVRELNGSVIITPPSTPTPTKITPTPTPDESLLWRENKRNSDVNTILNAVVSYAADHNGNISQFNLAPNTPTTIGSASGHANLCAFFIPNYLSLLPVDPFTSSTGSLSAIGDCSQPYNTNYTITYNNAANSVTISAPLAETAPVSVTAGL